MKSMKNSPLATVRIATLAALALVIPVLPAAGQEQSKVLNMSWDEIKAAARGGTVNWYMWGGSDRINTYVTERLGKVAQDEYGVTINRIGINDTADAVNTVLSEYEAGVNDDGSVDMIWINGENFRTLRQANLVFCGYLDKLPNNKYVDWNDASIAYDFGTAVDGCEVPWNKVQFAFAYDSARLAEPPRSMGALLDWIKANPGRFTYPAPPDFTGSVFVRHVFYHAAGGPEKLLGPFNQGEFDRVAAKTWEILNALEPSLWRAGATYPNNITALSQLFANQEVDFYFNYAAGAFGTMVDDGVFPPSVRSYGLKGGTIGNTNYVAIPRNSPNKAAALVVANIILSPEAQFDKANAEVWGQTSVLKYARLPRDIQQGFDRLPSHPSVVSSDELAKAALPELQAAWVTAIEKGWQEQVGK